jgi:hypothetical protein
LLARRRNWRAYERFRKDEAEPFLRKARAVVWSVEPPWVAKHGADLLTMLESWFYTRR